MSTPLPDVPAGGSPGLLSSLGTMLPLLIVIVGAMVMLVRKVMGGGFDATSDWISGLRRVSDQRRDGVIDGMREEIAGLRDLVSKLQADVEEVRRDHAAANRYGWRAYTEIVRLNPETSFPMPPMSSDRPESLADVQPPSD